MKKHAVKYALLLLVCCLMGLPTASCKKEEKKTSQNNNTQGGNGTIDPLPAADREMLADAAFVQQAVSDLGMMLGYMGEGIFTQAFYSAAPGGGTVTALRDTLAKYLVMSFNTTQCLDGTLRSGTVFGDYNYEPGTFPGMSQSARYFRDFGWAVRVTLMDYKVSDWKIGHVSNGALLVYNTLASPGYDPKATPLTWTIKGRLVFENLTDLNKSITWDGELSQTLLNTGDTAVFHPGKQKPINWKLAKLSYKGTATGSMSGSTTYTYTIDNSKPALRDFNCSVALSGTPTPGYTELHPFIDGNASMSWPAKAYTFHYGLPYIGIPGPCDNEAIVLVDGIEAHVKFK